MIYILCNCTIQEQKDQILFHAALLTIRVPIFMEG